MSRSLESSRLYQSCTARSPNEKVKEEINKLKKKKSFTFTGQRKPLSTSNPLSARLFPHFEPKKRFLKKVRCKITFG